MPKATSPDLDPDNKTIAKTQNKLRIFGNFFLVDKKYKNGKKKTEVAASAFGSPSVATNLPEGLTGKTKTEIKIKIEGRMYKIFGIL